MQNIRGTLLVKFCSPIECIINIYIYYLFYMQRQDYRNYIDVYLYILKKVNEKKKRHNSKTAYF